MRITITHQEVRVGLILRRTLYEVRTSVQFTPEERQTIQRRKLVDVIVLEREAGADVSAASAQETRKTFSQIFDLKFYDLLRRCDVYRVDTPLAAKQYDAKVRDALINLKHYLDANSEHWSGSRVFEL